MIRQLFPAWNYPKALADQDNSYFDSYDTAIAQIASSQDDHDNYSPAVLAASQGMYDGQATRREGINTRCGAVLSTAGILGALFVAAGQLGLTHKKSGFGMVDWLLLAMFIIALLYIGVSIALALAVHAARPDNVLDPTDLNAGANPPNVSSYNIQLAKKYLRYTVQNYGGNNKLTFQLHSAQRCLRNGVIAIIIAGALSPWY